MTTAKTQGNPNISRHAGFPPAQNSTTGVITHCLKCGASFAAPRKGQRYCSAPCRLAAFASRPHRCPLCKALHAPEGGA